MARVHHAEVIAHRVGEPFGSLLLALAVTVIELALVMSLMIAGGAQTASLARDTVFAAVMISSMAWLAFACCWAHTATMSSALACMALMRLWQL